MWETYAAWVLIVFFPQYGKLWGTKLLIPTLPFILAKFLLRLKCCRKFLEMGRKICGKNVNWICIILLYCFFENHLHWSNKYQYIIIPYWKWVYILKKGTNNSMPGKKAFNLDTNGSFLRHLLNILLCNI